MFRKHNKRVSDLMQLNTNIAMTSYCAGEHTCKLRQIRWLNGYCLPSFLTEDTKGGALFHQEAYEYTAALRSQLF